MHPGKGAQLVRSAGTAAQLMAKENGDAQIRMPSGEVRIVRTNCKMCISDSLVIVLNASDLAAAETTGAAALDALGTGAHGAAHGVLHRAAVRDTLFELLGDVLSDELSVHVGIANLDDVELDLLADQSLNRETQLLDQMCIRDRWSPCR